MGGPLFSIVLPVFNRENEVRRALESCLQQRFMDYQIVAVDDGSTDRTWHVVRSYQDHRILTLRHPYNRGVGPARNAGAAAACSDWLLFLDSDDELLPGALERIADEIQRCEPAIDRLAFSYIREDGTVSPEPALPSPLVDYEAYIRWADDVRLSDYLLCVRRRTFEVVKFPESRAIESRYHYDFASHFRTKAITKIVARVHTSARNRLSDWMKAASPGERKERARDNANSVMGLLATHEQALKAYAPRSLERFSRMRAQYLFLAGNRLKGLRFALAHLSAYPLSARSWALPALGVAGPLPLVWAANTKAAANKVLGGR